MVASGCNRNRCYSYGDWVDVEVGIGVSEYIQVTPGTEVVPGDDADGRHYDVALRGYGLGTGPVLVDLEAFVGEQRVAENRIGATARCVRWDLVELYNLRLDLDPADLPPMEPLPQDLLREPPPSTPPPPRDTGWFPVPEPIDSGWRWDSGRRWDSGDRWDSGWRRWDSGQLRYDGHADLRVVATVHRDDGLEPAVGETTWYLPR